MKPSKKINHFVTGTFGKNASVIMAENDLYKIAGGRVAQGVIIPDNSALSIVEDVEGF